MHKRRNLIDTTPKKCYGKHTLGIHFPGEINVHRPDTG